MTESGQLIQVAPLLLFIMPSTAIVTLESIGSITSLRTDIESDKIVTNEISAENRVQLIQKSSFNVGIVKPKVASSSS